MIKNIIFDFGGVIFTDDDIGVLFDNEELNQRFQTDQKTLENAWTKYWREVGENRMTIIEFYNSLQYEIIGKVDEDFSRELLKIYKKKTHTLEPYNLLPFLKKKYNLYAITNIFKEGYEFKKNKYRLNDLFKLIIAFCEVKISKANPEIFQILLNLTNIIPEESLFIDDREKNTIQAEKMGFKILLYDNIKNLKEKLNNFNIKYD